MSLAALIPLAGTLIERIFPDQESKDKAKLELLAMEMNGELSRIATASGVVTSEIQGESWLQRNWRPMTMLGFVGLVGAYWFGFTPVNLSENSIDQLFRLVQIGLGGYVVGRSAEKVAKNWKGNPSQ